MKRTIARIVSLIIQLIIPLVLWAILSESSYSFTDQCKIAVPFVLLSLLIFICLNRRNYGIIVIGLCFFLFQMGIPLLYAVIPNYHNNDLALFSQNVLKNGLLYTSICEIIFIFGLSLFSKKTGENKEISNKYISDNNSQNIYNVGKIIFIVSSAIAFPFAIYLAYQSFKNGYSFIKNDEMNAYNSIVKIAQQMIVPSMVLCVLYSNNKRSKRIYYTLGLIYAILLSISGTRTIGIILLLVLAIMYFTLKKRVKCKNIIIILSVILVAFAGSWIAQYRHSGKVDNSISNTFFSVIEEMGYNYTSVLFTMKYIPQHEDYKNGLSYYGSVVRLIPESIDLTGKVEEIANNSSPETWLANRLHSEYGSVYDFGVGYSVIAESYYNYGYYGFVAVLLQAIIIGSLMSSLDRSSNNMFAKYIYFVMLYSLATYPRRSFFTLIKSIEYCVLLVFVCIALYTIFHNSRLTARKRVIDG